MVINIVLVIIALGGYLFYMVKVTKGENSCETKNDKRKGLTE